VGVLLAGKQDGRGCSRWVDLKVLLGQRLLSKLTFNLLSLLRDLILPMKQGLLL
jgi:hypothetical protein